MARNNATIMGSESYFEIELSICDICGIDKKKYMENYKILTRVILESHIEDLMNFAKSYDDPLSVQTVLCVLLLRTGSILPDKIRDNVLKNISWEDEKDFWKMNPKFEDERKFYLQDFRNKIINYEAGKPIYLVNLKHHGNIDFNKTVIDTEQFGDIIEYNLEKSIKYLNLDSCCLEGFPKKLRKFTNLEFLSLENNHIKRISKDIFYLKKLRNLYLANNEIYRIPNNIEKLKNLELLDFSYNKLKSLPKNISNLSNLTHLDLSFNPLDTIPKDIKELNLDHVSKMKINSMDLKYV